MDSPEVVLAKFRKNRPPRTNGWWEDIPRNTGFKENAYQAVRAVLMVCGIVWAGAALFHHIDLADVFGSDDLIGVEYVLMMEGSGGQWSESQEVVAFCRKLNRIYQKAEAMGPRLGPKTYWQYMRTVLEGQERFGRIVNELHSNHLVTQFNWNMQNGTVLAEEMDASAKVTLKELMESRARILDLRPPVDWGAVAKKAWDALSGTYPRLLMLRLVFLVFGFIEARKRLSVWKEVRYAPLRLLGHIVFLWPGYPKFAEPAQYVRYVRLKAQYLRHKPFGYALSRYEDELLASRVSEPLVDIPVIAAYLAAVQEQAARRSLAWAYASILFVALVRPLLCIVVQPEAYAASAIAITAYTATIGSGEAFEQSVDERAPPHDAGAHHGKAGAVVPLAWVDIALSAKPFRWPEQLVRVRKLARAVEHVPRRVGC